jgi:hypothetical protein
MKIRIIVIVSVIFILILGSAICLTLNKRSKNNPYIVAEKLKEISQITTGQDIYREIIYSKSTKDVLWMPIINKEMLFSIEYNIITGIDLAQGYNIKMTDKTIYVSLPPVSILSIDAREETIDEYFVKERFTSIKKDDFFSIINETKNEISGNYRNKLTHDEEQGRAIIRTLLSFDNREIVIDYSYMGQNNVEN